MNITDQEACQCCLNKTIAYAKDTQLDPPNSWEICQAIRLLADQIVELLE